MKFDRILFPVDFSESSRTLNAQVEWLAARFNSTVTLLHVFEIPSSWYGGADAPMLSGCRSKAARLGTSRSGQKNTLAIC
jgi:nucleotide-binding universal stress UspA family protein